MCISNPRTCCRIITPRWWCRRAPPRSSAIRTSSRMCSASRACAMRWRRAAAGIAADHEITSGADALEKLRAGLTVEIRGSHDYLLPDVVKAINSLLVIPTSLTVCTDDVFPDYLVEKGGVNDVLRRLIRYGLDPLQAIRCATINNAIRLRRDDLGMVSAGRRADLVTLSNLREIAVETVYASGRRVAAQGRMIEAPRPAAAAPTGNTMKLPPLTLDDVRVRIPGLRNA